MKKLIFTLIAVLAVGILLYSFSVNRYVANSIEKVGYELTGQTVSVERVRISPFYGSGTIYGLAVKNPDGFSGEYALTISEISLKVDLMTLISDEVVVRELIIDELMLYAEQRMARNNLVLILNHLNDVTDSERSETGLIIERFRLNSGTVQLVTNNESAEPRTVSVEAIEMNDIGRGGVRNDVYKTVESIASELAEHALEGLIQSGVQQLIDGIRGLFD